MGGSNHGSSSSQVTVVDDSDSSIQWGEGWAATKTDPLAYDKYAFLQH